MQRQSNRPQLQPDNELWLRFRAGDRQAFEKLYKRHVRAMATYGRRLGAEQAVLEDAVQDVFVTLWHRREYLSEVDNPRFYLFRALRNQLTLNSRHNVLEQTDDLDDFLDRHLSLSREEQTINEETDAIRIRQVQQAIAKLSPRQQEAIHLRFYQGLNLDQIAELMAVSKQAVSNLLFKAYVLLRLAIKGLMLIFHYQTYFYP